jgi:transposase
MICCGGDERSGRIAGAIEDCRHVSGALERFLLASSERVVRATPRLMAGARRQVRERGKSDPIDAVAIAGAAIREGIETLPVAELAAPELDVRLLVDHRERLVAHRTALINDLRWNLHDLWPYFDIPLSALRGPGWQQKVSRHLIRAARSARVCIARDELRRIRELTRTIDARQRELAELLAQLAPRLLAERGCGILTAAKLVGEAAGIGRFASDAKLARSSGTAGSQHPRAAPTATALTAAATASSTARFTGSLSARAAWTPKALHISPADRLTARPAVTRPGSER